MNLIIFIEAQKILVKSTKGEESEEFDNNMIEATDYQSNTWQILYNNLIL